MQHYDALERFREKNPDAIIEETILNGEYFTVSRVTIHTGNGTIIGEGVSKRSGPQRGLPDEPSELGAIISLGRARKAAAIKLERHKTWVKLSDKLMG